MLDLMVGMGLLSRAGGAPATPPTRPKLRNRSEINRQNALKRWRKTPPDASPMVQRELSVMQVVGGRGAPTSSKPQPTSEIAENRSQPVETAAEMANSITPKLKLEESKQAKLKVADDSDYVRVTRAANEAAGLDIERTRDFGQVRTWLQRGYTAEFIVEVVRSSTRPGVTHLGYFGPALAEAAERQDAPPSAADWRSDPIEVAWTEAIDAWMADGFRGHKPLLADFRRAMAVQPTRGNGVLAVPADASHAWEEARRMWAFNGRRGPAPKLEDFRVMQAAESTRAA
jgi:hypothetical protein